MMTTDTTLKNNQLKHDNKMATTEPRNYDIVLYGASSFVGKLTADYIYAFLSKTNNSGEGLNDATLATDNEKKEANNLDNNNKSHSVKWAIAGRNQQKLDQLKKELGDESLDIIIADSEDPDSLDEMTKQTRVIISTVGPYLKFGEPLIKACVNNGTDYVDLTGEAIFIKNMMDKYKKKAEASGARIVNSCGFDSIPSDLGVLFTQKCAHELWGEYCNNISMRVKAAKGGLSGGTLASIGTIFEAAAKDDDIRKKMANPYLLNDDTNPPKVKQTSLKKPMWDDDNNRWLAPFIMDSINTRIVHRSNQLKDYEYGRDFKYDEAIWMPSGLKGKVMSYGMTLGTAGFSVGMMFKPTRELLNDHILPKSGSGPDKEDRENGYFDLRFFGDVNGKQLITKVSGDQDPGYAKTSKMLAQSALCLLQDISKDEVGGGFWTSASAMGENLITRLQNHAGIKFERLTFEKTT